MNKPWKTLQASTLRLAYDFASDPDPILASDPDETANAVNLTMMISNRGTSSVSFDKIDIKIPVGEDSARCLSTDPTLPQPINDNPEQCSMNSNGSVVTITGPQGNALIMEGQAIIFHLNKIIVNDVAGTVPITITEYLSEGEKITDANSYVLTKEVFDYPVTSFYANPKFCYESGGTVTLYWTCSEAGQDCAYKVHSDSWHDDTLYTANDGANGVVSGEIYVDTTFALDIYKTDSDGYRTLISTLYTEVPIVVPTFYNTNYQANTGGNQRLVTLWWTAINAAYCEIQVNEKTYISNVPTKTPPEGYLLFIAENDTGQTMLDVRIAVIAHAEEGNATATYYVPFSLEVPCSAQHAMPYAIPQITSTNNNSQNTFGIALSLDHKQAFVMAQQNTAYKIPTTDETWPTYVPWMNKISLPGCSCSAIKLSDDLFNLRLSNVAVSQDSAYTAINTVNSKVSYSTVISYIKKVHLDNNGKIDNLDSSGGELGLSVSSDGQFLVMAQSTNPQVTNPQPQGMLSFKTNPLSQIQQVSLNQNFPCQTAIAPDGQKVFVTNKDSNSVSVLSLSNGALTLLTTLNVGLAPTTTTITPDGQLALVTNSGSHDISVINIANLTVEDKTIPAGGNNPFALAITADSQYAYVVNYGSGNLTLINIAQRRCAAGAFAIGKTPVTIAIATLLKPAMVLIAQENSVTLTSLPL